MAMPMATPHPIHAAFDASLVQAWDPCRFEYVRKLQSATRNRGAVFLMYDKEESALAAVKQMPNEWVQDSHEEFIREHPHETEQPWNDIGALAFLGSRGFPFLCKFFGVFRNETSTGVASAFAAGGDLFGWCDQVPFPPGPDREAAVWPLMVQVVHAVQTMHDMSVQHRDLSMENILLSEHASEGPANRIKLIDFAMCSTERWLLPCTVGKPAYQAPEVHGSGEYDGFLADAFSVGVTIYAVAMKDYPWMSTRPGYCKCFKYHAEHGFRAYIKKRKVRNQTSLRVGDVMSEPLISLLEGLLAISPAERLTLGEAGAWPEGCRKSAWEEPWMRSGPGFRYLSHDEHPAVLQELPLDAQGCAQAPKELGWAVGAQGDPVHQYIERLRHLGIGSPAHGPRV